MERNPYDQLPTYDDLRADKAEARLLYVVALMMCIALASAVWMLWVLMSWPVLWALVVGFFIGRAWQSRTQ